MVADHAERKVLGKEQIIVTMNITGPGLEEVRKHYGYTKRGNVQLTKLLNKKINIILQD
jgi:hypothetical protein